MGTPAAKGSACQHQARSSRPAKTKAKPLAGQNGIDIGTYYGKQYSHHFAKKDCACITLLAEKTELRLQFQKFTKQGGSILMLHVWVLQSTYWPSPSWASSMRGQNKRTWKNVEMLRREEENCSSCCRRQLWFSRRSIWLLQSVFLGNWFRTEPWESCRVPTTTFGPSLRKRRNHRTF